MEHNVELINNTKSGFWRLSRPFLLLTFFEAFYALIDMFWVSKMSQEAFFAIGIALPFVTLISNFGKSIGTGTLSIISREIGAKDYEASYNSLLHGMVCCGVLAVSMVLVIPFLSNILALMNVTESVSLVKQYLIPILLFSFVFLFSNLFIYTLQAEGNSRIPTILLIFSNVLNLILDPILIFVLNWGVSGAAFATILSCATIAVYLLYWYLGGKSQVVLNFKYFKPGIPYDILIVAIPSILMDGLLCLVSSFINVTLIKQLGEIGVILYSAVSKIKDVILAPQKAFGKSLMTIGGQLFGAGKFTKLISICNYVFVISTVITFVMGIFLFVIRDYVFALLSVTGVETYVFYIAFVGIFVLSLMQFSALSERVMAGIGKSYDALFINVGVSIFKVLLIYIIAPIFTSGVCVLIGILIGELLCAVAYYMVLNLIIRRILKKNQFQTH